MKTLAKIFLCLSLIGTASAQTNIQFNESFFGDTITYLNSKNEKQKVGINVYGNKGNKHTVIYLHGCGGVKSYATPWFTKFKEWGYNVVVIDSFRHRWLGEACYNTEYISKKPYERVDDLHAAAEWIMQQPWNKGKPAAVGFSHGAQVLHIASNMQYVEKSKRLLSSGVAFYPFCHTDIITDKDAKWPFQMHLGELDDWTPESRCRGHSSFQSNTFDYRVYEGAHHGWDMGFSATMNAMGEYGFIRPRTIAPNAQADRDSSENTKKWLAKFFN